MLRSLIVVGGLMALSPAAADDGHPCRLSLATPTSVTAGVLHQGAGVICNSTPDGGPDADTFVNFATIDLETAGLSVQASNAEQGVFTEILTSSVVDRNSTKRKQTSALPQIAINANLFLKCCTDSSQTSPWTTALRGLEISGGNTNSAALANAQCAKIPYATFASSLIVNGSAKTAAIWTAQYALQPAPINTTTAVTGSHLLLSGATNIAPVCSEANSCLAPNWMGPNARTAVGLKNAKTLIFAVSSGTDSKVGLTLYQLADVLQQYGATDAINLDGGGSSTMARQDEENGFVVLSKLTDASTSPCVVQAPSKNAPIGTGCERYVGAVIYVEAP